MRTMLVKVYEVLIYYIFMNWRDHAEDQFLLQLSTPE